MNRRGDAAPRSPASRTRPLVKRPGAAIDPEGDRRGRVGRIGAVSPRKLSSRDIEGPWRIEGETPQVPQARSIRSAKVHHARVNRPDRDGSGRYGPPPLSDDPSRSALTCALNGKGPKIGPGRRGSSPGFD